MVVNRQVEGFFTSILFNKSCQDREKVSFFVENDQADEFTLKHFVAKYFLGCFEDLRLYLTSGCSPHHSSCFGLRYSFVGLVDKFSLVF